MNLIRFTWWYYYNENFNQSNKSESGLFIVMPSINF